jgi:glycosyltransferase involved in cell wall biosynthesis
MNRTPLISIITTFYNEAICLERCLASIAKQTYKNIEVILINDGSTDASLEIAESFGHQFGMSKIISIENSGHSEARNIGLKNATGEYLTFLDADDEFEAEMITTCVKNILQHKTDLCICKFKIMNNAGNPTHVSGWKEGISNIKTTVALVPQLFSYGVSETVWGKLFKTEMAQQITFEKGIWFDDNPFLLEYLFKAKIVSFVEESLLKIHKRDTSITRRTIEAKRITDSHLAFLLQLNTVKKYDTDSIIKYAVVKHHISVLMDNYLLQLIDKKDIANATALQKVFLDNVQAFKTVIKNESIPLKLKDSIIIKILTLPKIVGWNTTSFLMKILKRKRLQDLARLK